MPLPLTMQSYNKNNIYLACKNVSIPCCRRCSFPTVPGICFRSHLAKKIIYFTVLGTCATFSATAPLARTRKGGARRGGSKVKKNGAGQWRENKIALNRAAFPRNF